MFLPIGDHPNPRGTPLVTYALIAVNAAVFLLLAVPLMGHAADPSDPRFLEYVELLQRQGRVPIDWAARHVSQYDLLVFEYGFRPASASLMTLFTSLFLHGGWMHLIGNMLFLWIYGDNVEYELGRLRYLFVYLLTGVAATLFFALFQLDSEVPLVGASGAISGVLGCYYVWFPRNQVKVLVVFIFLANVIFIPARWVIGFYILAENLLPLLFGRGGSVAYGAHIGGFLGGLTAAWAVRRWQARPPAPAGADYRRKPRGDFAEVEPVAARTAGALRRFIDAGDWAGAVEYYADLPAAVRNGLGEADVFALVDGLTDRREADAALAILQRYIATHPNSPHLAQAHLRAGLILLHLKARPTAAYQHLLAVLDLDAPAEVADAAREALAQLDARGRGRALR